ncbi:MAG: hypothetical protein ACLR5G_02810 [Eubacteriales bacterium]
MKEKSGGEVSLAKKMGIGSLIASAVFFFNPCINIIDPLPDFFGVVLLINGLRKWGDLCPGISDAIQGLQKLRWLMLLKMLFMALVPIVDDTYVLIFTFGFAILELIYMLPAIGRIFDGFEYFGTRFNGRSVYRDYKNVRTLTYMFFVGKSILVVLPELCSLSSYEYSGYVTAGVQIDFARYKYPLLGVGIFLTAHGHTLACQHHPVLEAHRERQGIHEEGLRSVRSRGRERHRSRVQARALYGSRAHYGGSGVLPQYVVRRNERHPEFPRWSASCRGDVEALEVHDRHKAGEDRLRGVHRGLGGVLRGFDRVLGSV